jgi:hypothetical protein
VQVTADGVILEDNEGDDTEQPSPVVSSPGTPGAVLGRVNPVIGAISNVHKAFVMLDSNGWGRAAAYDAEDRDRGPVIHPPSG